MTLEEAMRRGRCNNLDALRLGAAAAVVVSHAWPLALGPGIPEPLKLATGHSLGGWAVALFFFLSGLFIANSASRHAAGDFWLRRAARILPGLALALVVGLALAIASGGRSEPALAAEYLLRGITLVSIEHNLSGAWPNNPWPGAVNGPLWSLFHEVVAYGLAFIAIQLGLLRARLSPALLLAFSFLLWALAPALGQWIARITVFAPLWLSFALGMAAWRWREHLPLRWDVALGLWAAFLFVGGWPIGVAAIGYGALMIGHRLPARALPVDLSYGVYIFGWPVSQAILHFAGPMPPERLAFLSLAAVIPVAWASWHHVEARALRAALPPVSRVTP